MWPDPFINKNLVSVPPTRSYEPSAVGNGTLPHGVRCPLGPHCHPVCLCRAIGGERVLSIWNRRSILDFAYRVDCPHHLARERDGATGPSIVCRNRSDGWILHDLALVFVGLHSTVQPGWWIHNGCKLCVSPVAVYSCFGRVAVSLRLVFVDGIIAGIRRWLKTVPPNTINFLNSYRERIGQCQSSPSVRTSNCWSPHSGHFVGPVPGSNVLAGNVCTCSQWLQTILTGMCAHTGRLA